MTTKKKVITLSSFADAQFWEMKILGGMLPDYWGGYIPPWICTHGYEEVRNYRKTLFIQSIVENGWWGGCIPYIPLPLDPPLYTGIGFAFISPTWHWCSVGYHVLKCLQNINVYWCFFKFHRNENTIIKVIKSSRCKPNIFCVKATKNNQELPLEPNQLPLNLIAYILSIEFIFTQKLKNNP